MNTVRWGLGFLVWSMSVGALASDFDGSKALICEPKVVNDCLPGAACSRHKPGDVDMATSVSIDFARKEVRTQYRTKPLPITTHKTTKDQSILQGTDGRMAWSSVILLADGAITITIADLKGAYVLFGQCKVAPPEAAPAAAPAAEPAAPKPE